MGSACRRNKISAVGGGCMLYVVDAHCEYRCKPVALGYNRVALASAAVLLWRVQPWTHRKSSVPQQRMTSSVTGFESAEACGLETCYPYTVLSTLCQSITCISLRKHMQKGTLSANCSGMEASLQTVSAEPSTSVRSHQI
jgi:hypothetical protein